MDIVQLCEYSLNCTKWWTSWYVKVNRKVAQSCPNLCDPIDCSLPGSSLLGILQARILEWVAVPFSKWSSQSRDGTQVLPHCRWILYHLRSRRILEWAAKPFSSGSSQPMNWTRVSCLAGEFFTNWATKEALIVCEHTSVLKKQYLPIRSNKKLFKDFIT